MTTNQPLDLDAIEAVADAATPGPWGVDSSIAYGHRVGSSDEADWVAWTGEHGETGSEADAAFIAAVNPVVALALVAEVRRLRAELARQVQCNDCGAVGEVFTGVDGLAYLDPSGQIGHKPAARGGRRLRSHT